MGRDDDDPLLLQFKEAQPSVLEEFLGSSEFPTHGPSASSRGSTLMQAASDILLGWHRGIGIDGVERDFFVRQLWDTKGSVDLKTIDAGGMKIYASVWVDAPTPIPDPATRQRSPATSATGVRSIAPWSTSPTGTPIRTDATTSSCNRRSPTVAWPPPRGDSDGRPAVAWRGRRRPPLAEPAAGRDVRLCRNCRTIAEHEDMRRNTKVGRR